MGRQKRNVSVVGELPQAKTLRSHQRIDSDSLILAAIETVAKKHNRTDQLAGSPKTLNHVLAVPALAVRYLVQNEGWPLGLVSHIAGPPAVYKSTLGVEIGRWHRDLGGAIIICGAEDKDTPDLRSSVLDWDEAGVIYRDCEYIEVWQSTIIDYIQAIKKNLAKATNKYVPPVAFIVDSYMGKLPKRIYDQVLKTGHASKHFGEAAALIGDWLAAYSSIVRDMPFTLIGINHLKEKIDPVTGIKSYTTPGGQFLKHQNVTEITVRRGATRTKEQKGVAYQITDIKLKTTKNSRGAERKQIIVPLKQWNEYDAEADRIRLYSVFEWYEATMQLLSEGTGMSADEAKILLPKIKQIIDIRSLSKRRDGEADIRYWCPELGVSQSDAIFGYELNELLENNDSMLSALYAVLGVVRRPYFDANIPYEAQLNEYADEAGSVTADE